MPLIRLTGGLTPPDGSDPRTFPGIFNALVDYVEDLELTGGGGGGGTGHHPDLTGRLEAGQHPIGSITGLQSALDGKQPVGSYAQTNHTHGVVDINAGGTRSSNTFLRGDGQWALPPSGGGSGVTAHGDLTGRNESDQHSIGAISGLQGALDGKQPAGSYVLATDARLADSRTPKIHAESHDLDGSDPILPESIGAVASTTIRTIVPITQEAFDALPNKSVSTMYVVTA